MLYVSKSYNALILLEHESLHNIYGHEVCSHQCQYIAFQSFCNSSTRHKMKLVLIFSLWKSPAYITAWESASKAYYYTEDKRYMHTCMRSQHRIIIKLTQSFIETGKMRDWCIFITGRYNDRYMDHEDQIWIQSTFTRESLIWLVIQCKEESKFTVGKSVNSLGDQLKYKFREEFVRDFMCLSVNTLGHLELQEEKDIQWWIFKWSLGNCRQCMKRITSVTSHHITLAGEYQEQLCMIY